MPLENELHLMYDGEAESLKVNLEDLKRHKEAQAVKASKRLKKKTHARSIAKSNGYHLGRWTGTYAKIKKADDDAFTGLYFNMNTFEASEDRPGKGSAPQSYEKPVS